MTEQATPEPVAPTNGGGEDVGEEFDFDAHRQKALEEYQPLTPLYADFARAVYSILRTCIDKADIKVHSVDHRVKSPEDFADKAAAPSDENPEQPKYEQPLVEITDLAGVRVITYFLSTEKPVSSIIETEFEVLEKTDKSQLLEEEERLGYHSIHYLVRLLPNRYALPEYARFSGLVAEIQVRTILQHAWAEIEHDIQYKAVSTLPKEIRRRFMTLAGMLEVADREFQALEDEDVRLREQARTSVAEGHLDAVEITPDALKSYLDKRLGPDGRMSEFSYRWDARLLRQLGFADLQQLDAALEGYDDDRLSRVADFGRQGQLTRLETMLLAAMGEEFIRRNPLFRAGIPWWEDRQLRRLERLRSAGVEIRELRPERDGQEPANGY